MKREIRNISRATLLNLLVRKYNFSKFKSVLGTPRVQFFYFHDLPDFQINNFVNFIRLVKQHYEVVSYSKAIELLKHNDLKKPVACFSSDDGFKSNIKAAEILADNEISYCLFLNPDSISLQNQEVIEKFCRNNLQHPPREFLSWEDIAYLQKLGHEIGSHTIGHINMANYNDAEIQDNLEQSKAILESKCGPISHFAYPFGRHFHITKTGIEMVYKCNYDSCASAERGCHTSTMGQFKKDYNVIFRDQIELDNIKFNEYFDIKNILKSSAA